MPREILVVPDKFKGTLTAQTAAALIAQGWKCVHPADALVLLPMSDGGDGFGEVLAGLLQMERRFAKTLDAAHRPLDATWWRSQETGTAIVESARIIGLALLPQGQFHPFDLDTFGLGAVLQEVASAGSTQCVIGIGGSATNDGGFGCARALGWGFFGAKDAVLERWTELAGLMRIAPPPNSLALHIRVAVDVQNPMLGPAGASRIYGPQKGLRAEDWPLAEACLGRLAEVVHRDLGLEIAAMPGDGAAGGLGFGLRSFLNARLESGFDLFARYARLEERIRASTLVITGEGAIDESTFMGKGVGRVAELCRRFGVPCLGLAGTLALPADGEPGPSPFNRIYGVVPQLASPDAAQAQPEFWLPRLSALAARDWE